MSSRGVPRRHGTPSRTPKVSRDPGRRSYGLGGRRQEWRMTTPLTAPADPPLTRAHVALTAKDAERIATAVRAELATSTRETYAGGWRQWERWCQGRDINPRPAPPEAVAAFLAERAEAGAHFSTLDCYCSGIAYRHRQEGPGGSHRRLSRTKSPLRTAPDPRGRADPPSSPADGRRAGPDRRVHRHRRRQGRTSATGPSCSSGTPPR